MYVCRKCGKTFEEVVEVHDDPSPAGVGLTSGYYTYYKCPYCGSDDVGEAQECAVCGEYFSDDGEEVCEDCWTTIMKDLQDYRLEMGLTEDQFDKIMKQMF